MEIINSGMILLDEEISSKDQLFDVIAALFSENGYVTDADEFKKALYVRESEAPTGIGSMCAIPHGISDVVLQPGVCFVRMKDSIDYPEISEQTGKVRYVFSLAIPAKNTSDHVKVLSTIACLLMEKPFQELIAVSSEKSEILDAIREELHKKGL